MEKKNLQYQLNTLEPASPERWTAAANSRPSLRHLALACRLFSLSPPGQGREGRDLPIGSGEWLGAPPVSLRSVACSCFSPSDGVGFLGASCCTIAFSSSLACPKRPRVFFFPFVPMRMRPLGPLLGFGASLFRFPVMYLVIRCW
jgi:hypothetical protein